MGTAVTALRRALAFFAPRNLGPWILIAVLAGGTYLSIQGWNSKQHELANTQQTVREMEQRATEKAEEARRLADVLAQAERRADELREANGQLQREVRNASQENPEWSRTRTPDAVIDSLCQRIRCASD